MSRHIAIIGGGPAAIEAAKAAAAAKARVTLISDSPLGGRAGWHSLLPSKVWLTAADTTGLLHEAGRLGLPLAEEPQPRPEAILARIKAVKEAWNGLQEKRLRDLGVEIVTGTASFASSQEILVKNDRDEPARRLHPEATIIAAGSVPFFPPNLKPDGQRVLAPRFASQLDWLPDSVVVIGAGATGSETVYLFNRLGARVTWIVDQFGVLPTFARPAGQFLTDVLQRRGVKMVNGLLADRIERDETGVTVVLSDGSRQQAAMAFVAIGRFADLSRLNLEAAGLPVEKGQAPAVDAFGRTRVDGIYAVGDAAGPPMLANRAMAQAWVAGKHAACAHVPPFRPETVVHAIYSEPQVAEVGSLAETLQRVRLSFSEGLKAQLLPEGDGFVELTYDDKRRVTGGLAVGLHAADVLAPVAVAIQQHATIDDLASMFAAHPTMSELAFLAARLA